jgi:broad specificity phosphatase PhoE
MYSVGEDHSQERRGVLVIPSAKIVLARHGQTVSNRDGFIMGHSDALLTSQGLETAKAVSRIIAPEGVQRIVSSALGRAALTAAIHSERLRVPISFTEAIAELSCGSWEGRRRVDVITGSKSIRGTWQFRPPGGESYQDGETRVGSLVGQILRTSDCEAVLVVGHASVNRVFLKLLLDLDPLTAMTICFPHDTVYVIDHREGVRHASPFGRMGNGFLTEAE